MWRENGQAHEAVVRQRLRGQHDFGVAVRGVALDADRCVLELADALPACGERSLRREYRAGGQQDLRHGAAIDDGCHNRAPYIEWVRRLEAAAQAEWLRLATRSRPWLGGPCSAVDGSRLEIAVDDEPDFLTVNFVRASRA